MNVELTSPKPLGVPLSAMADGDIALVTKWTNPTPVGKIVQRYGDNLVVLGRPKNQGYTGVFSDMLDNACLVIILEPGTVLTLKS